MHLRSLVIKVNLLIAFILVVALGVSSYITERNLERQALNEASRRANILSTAIMNSIIVEMNGFCQKDVQKIVATVGAIPEIERVRIFDEEGTINYSADPRETGRKVDDEEFSSFRSSAPPRPIAVETGGHRAFCMVQPIENGRECQRCHNPDKDVLGVLDVCVAMQETEKQIAENGRFLFLSTLVTVALVVLSISLSIWFLVNRPVKNLVRTMAKAEKGNLKARAVPSSRDELGRLALSFNSMLDQLDSSERELKRLHAEQLRRADRLATLGELAAGVAHEIKNPLAGIAGATQILAREFGEGDPRYPVTQEILKLIERLDHTIRDLLDFSRPSVPSLLPVNLNQVLEKTLFLVEGMPEAKINGVAVRTLPDPALPTIPADPNLLRQVFLNLSVNAIQAMSRGGVLTIATRSFADPARGEVHPPEGFVEVSFSDTGPGIEKDKLRSIFTPFFTTKTQGTGLGLTICLRIVEQHGGRITVESEPGKGTVFHVYLPRTPAVSGEGTGAG
jgi:two-component system NtrC family sensor kinase